MFPPNWDVLRIQEEVAWVYENTVAKELGLTGIFDDIYNYEGVSSIGFKIRIQIKDGKIISAHPIKF
jgi:hypothetical protein